MSAPEGDPELPPLPVAPVLRAYLDRQEVTVPDWCEATGLDRFQIQKLLNGKLQRVSVELAFDIAEATSGEVPAELCVPAAEVRDAQREKRRAVARARFRAQRDARTEATTEKADNGAR